MPLRRLKNGLILALILLILPAAHLPAQGRWADRWPCPRAIGTYHHVCSVNGRPTPYLLILIQHGLRREVLEGIHADIEDSIDFSDAGTRRDLFEDIKDDFLDDQESDDPYDTGYYDIDEVLRLRGTTFDNIIWAAVQEEFSLQTRAQQATMVKKRAIGNRVVYKLDGAFPR